jgi:O-antigen ligase
MRQLDLPRRYRGSAELGWHSDFRRTMNALAWRKIRRHPIVGNGFAFTREELVAVVGAARRGGLRNAQEALATSGGYHNTLIQMAVICGIPTVLLFVIAFVAIPRRFAMLVRSVADPQTTVFAALLLGFFVASSVQMLTNGSGVDLFVVCCLLGIMNGIMYRIGKHRQHVASSSSPRERSAASK